MRNGNVAGVTTGRSEMERVGIVDPLMFRSSDEREDFFMGDALIERSSNRELSESCKKIFDEKRWVSFVRSASGIDEVKEIAKQRVLDGYRWSGESLSLLSEALGKSRTFLQSVLRQTPEKFFIFEEMGQGDIALGIDMWNDLVEEEVFYLSRCVEEAKKQGVYYSLLEEVAEAGVYDRRYCSKGISILLGLLSRDRRQLIHRIETYYAARDILSIAKRKFGIDPRLQMSVGSF